MDIFRKGELYDEGRLGAPDFSWSDYKTERVRDYALVKLRGLSEQRCEFKKEANEKSAQCFCRLSDPGHSTSWLGASTTFEKQWELSIWTYSLGDYRKEDP